MRQKHVERSSIRVLNWLAIVALIGALAGPNAPAARAATTLFVDPAGVDALTCGPASAPCKTIGAAIDRAAAGDTIQVAAGTYHERLAIAKDLTLNGTGVGDTIIDGDDGGTVVTVRGATVAIGGVTIQHGHNREVNSFGGGGGVANLGVLTLNDSLVADNIADGQGGGINNGTGPARNPSIVLTLNNTTVTRNSTGGDGGGANNYGTLILNNSTVSRNSASIFGGGFRNEGDLTVNSSTISENTTPGFAGAIELDIGSVTLNNSTVTGNTAGGAGGGLYKVNSFTTLTISGSLVAGNTGSSAPDCFGTIISRGFNLVGNAAGCELAAASTDRVGNGDTRLDPRLGPLANNGGPTQTHALLPGSPAIDAGGPSCPGADQRGRPRPAGAACDIGAYERGDQATWHVAPAGADRADCLTPATACQTIGGAIRKAAPGDAIAIAAGTYHERLGIAFDLAISGAGAGATVLDGDQAGTVVTVAGGANVALTGLEIRNGKTSGSGGGINNTGTLALTDSVVRDSSAAGNGGGIANSGALRLLRSTVSGNRADDATAGSAGGIQNLGGTVILEDSEVVGNSAAVYGGGIANFGGTMTVERSTIGSNTSTGAAFGAGGIFNNRALVIRDSTLSSNTAAGNGGAIRNNGVLAIVSTTLSGNAAAAGGGALYTVGETSVITMTSVTLTRNRAGTSGGGLNNVDSSVALAGTILAENSAPTAPDCFGTAASQGFNLIGNDSGCNLRRIDTDLVGSGDFLIDTRLGPLTNNGGPTQTHALLPGSPAIDAGGPSCPAADQRGVARPQGAACDIGAYEASAPGAGDRLRLVFARQPGGAIEGQPFASQPIVEVQDQRGNVANYSGPITIELINNAGIRGAELAGTTVAEARNGQASFDGLSIGAAGTGYQLAARAAGALDATSELFAVRLRPRPPNEPPPGPEPEHEINDTIEQAEQVNQLVFDALGQTARVGTIHETGIVTPDIDFFAFYAPPGARVEVGLSNLPDDYDVLVTADPRATLPISDDIDLSNISDLPRIGIPRIGIPRIGIPRIGIPRIGIGGISSNRGTADEALKAYLPSGGQYFVLVYGANGTAFDSKKQYRLDVRLIGDGLMAPTFRAHPLASLRAGAPADASVRTLYLYHPARMEARYRAPEEAAAVTALRGALAPSGRLLASAGELEPAAAIDLGADLTISDTDNLIALYNQWDANPDQPLLSNEVAQQLWYVIDFALTNRYPKVNSVVLVGNDEIIPFYRVPDETDLANERDYFNSIQTIGGFAGGTPLAGSLSNSFVQTDNFYADRRPTPWRGRALYLPDMGVGRLVERPTEIMHYLNGYLASGKYTIDASAPIGGSTGALVTGYDFLMDEAQAITSTLITFGFGGQTSPLTVTVGPSWSADDLANTLFGGQLPQLGEGYAGPSTRYYLTSLNGHFDHAGAEPALAASGVISAARILSPTVSPGNDASAFFKLNGGPTLIYSVGCHSGLNVSDSAFGDPAWQADFPQAVLKQGGNWIGNTSYGYGDTELIGYSERLSLKFTEALGRRITAPGSQTYVGATLGEALARAKRQYLLSNGSSTFNIYDEKILEAMTLYGLPFIRVKVPTPTQIEQHPPVDESRWAGLGDENGVFTRLITVTNVFAFAALPAKESVPRATSVVSDSFLPAATTIRSADQMAQGRPVLPLLAYDITLPAARPEDQPTPRGVSLLSATALPDLDFRPHVTATLSDRVELTPIRPPLAFQGVWTPPQPYTYQRAAEQISASDTMTTDMLLVTPVQFRARNDRTGTLRRFVQMVFAVTYVNPRRAPAEARAPSEPPSFTRAQISSSGRGSGKVLRFRANVAGDGIAGVSALYSVDGVHWRRVELPWVKRDRYSQTTTTPAAGRVFAFFEAKDELGRVTVETVARRYKRLPSQPAASLAAPQTAEAPGDSLWAGGVSVDEDLSPDVEPYDDGGD